MANLLKKIVMGAIASAALCAAATPASAAIVRSAAGVLSSGYHQQVFPTWVPTYPPGSGYYIYLTEVIEDATGIPACIEAGLPTYCNANWIGGYTVTGNGWEVTKP